ncbi:HAD hydrolase-like protein [Mycobacterium botniense]|uniref:Haloacid dehalogenase n=1 Tax=Mycobacterium botniense TaxID=84962 RepID=A0A7I9XUN8_9MYCO|nr:HAD hydrolase-like protein [Mycobacterium botniense]GFG73076.1 haloacid dehalogenase [Mycobacterium botniense]
MRTVPMQTRPARTFWWDRARPGDADVEPLRAVLFDAETALVDLERDAQRVAYNAAFDAHDLDISWGVEEYGRLLRIADEHQRVASALGARGFGAWADTLAARVCATQKAIVGERILDGDIAARPGLVDLVMGLFVAGTWVGVVSTCRRSWVEALVRNVVGEGLVETIVTGDDADRPGDVELYRLALWELGITPESALAVTGSGRGLAAALAVGLPTVVVTTDYSACQNFTGAAALRSGYDGADPLVAAGCQQLHRQWVLAQKRLGTA